MVFLCVEAETDKLLKKLTAETASEVAKINMEIELLEKGAKQQMEYIDSNIIYSFLVLMGILDQIYINHKRAKAEAEKCF